MTMTNENVKTYLFDSTNVDDLTTKQLLVKLFTEQQIKKCRTQSDIAEILRTTYNVDRKQSAISKNLRKLIDTPFVVKGITYVVSKYDGQYIVETKNEHSNSLRGRMVQRNLFKRKYVHFEKGTKNPQTFVFWIADSEEAHKEAKENFHTILSGEYVDMFYIEDKLIIMLESKSNQLSDMLRNFFDSSYDAFKHI